MSVTFQRDELDGAGYDTNGHLLTIVGFTADGDVISNDPNSHTIASNEQVRTVYRRDQFERVWLGDDGGLAYVMAPPDVRAARAARRGELALTGRSPVDRLDARRIYDDLTPRGPERVLTGRAVPSER